MVEKGAFTTQALQLSKLSKYDCYLIFQLDSIALQDKNLNLPTVLLPPDSNYFAEVGFIFLVGETILNTCIKDPKKLGAVVGQPDLILPASLRNQLCKSNMIRIGNQDELPANVFV